MFDVFADEHAACAEPPRRFADDRLEVGETGHAAGVIGHERAVGLVAKDGVEGRELGCADVGRIGDDEVDVDPATRRRAR